MVAELFYDLGTTIALGTKQTVETILKLGPLLIRKNKPHPFIREV